MGFISFPYVSSVLFLGSYREVYEKVAGTVPNSSRFRDQKSELRFNELSGPV